MSATYPQPNSVHAPTASIKPLSDAFNLSCVGRYHKGHDVAGQRYVSEEDLERDLSSEQKETLHHLWPMKTLDEAMYRQGESIHHYYHDHPVTHALDPTKNTLYLQLLKTPGLKYSTPHAGYARFEDSTLPRSANKPEHHRLIDQDGLHHEYAGLEFAWHAELLWAMARSGHSTTLAWIRHCHADLCQAITVAAARKLPSTEPSAVPDADAQTRYLNRLQQMYLKLHKSPVAQPRSASARETHTLLEYLYHRRMVYTYEGRYMIMPFCTEQQRAEHLYHLGLPVAVHAACLNYATTQSGHLDRLQQADKQKLKALYPQSDTVLQDHNRTAVIAHGNTLQQHPDGNPFDYKDIRGSDLAMFHQIRADPEHWKAILAGTPDVRQRRRTLLTFTIKDHIALLDIRLELQADPRLSQFTTRYSEANTALTRAAQDICVPARKDIDRSPLVALKHFLSYYNEFLHGRPLVTLGYDGAGSIVQSFLQVGRAFVADDGTFRLFAYCPKDVHSQILHIHRYTNYEAHRRGNIRDAWTAKIASLLPEARASGQMQLDPPVIVDAAYVLNVTSSMDRWRKQLELSHHKSYAASLLSSHALPLIHLINTVSKVNLLVLSVPLLSKERYRAQQGDREDRLPCDYISTLETAPSATEIRREVRTALINAGLVELALHSAPPLKGLTAKVYTPALGQFEVFFNEVQAYTLQHDDLIKGSTRTYRPARQSERRGTSSIPLTKARKDDHPFCLGSTSKHEAPTAKYPAAPTAGPSGTQPPAYRRLSPS